MTIKSELLEFLSRLPNVETSRNRQALMMFIGFDSLSNQIDWEGTSLEFFSGLLELLARRGKNELLTFLDEVAKTPWVLDVRQKEKLLEFRAAIAGCSLDTWYTPARRRGLDSKALIQRCQSATAQEIKIVGTKYISELYFPRYRLEAKFDRFLNSDATCFLVVAKAGRGKTNLMCHIVEAWQDRRPVLFIAGRKDPQDDYDFLRHIAIRLGYIENWPVCFQDLKAISKPGAETLILIDGINESSASPSVMQGAMRELLIQANLHHLKVCVTCRTDFWRFYRAPFWSEYIWKDNGEALTGKVVRGEDLSYFPEENFGKIVQKYFEYFGVKGELVEEACERCRNPLLLRFFCEAYRDRTVQTVSRIHLYTLFKLFWNRKIEQVQDFSGLPQPYPVNQLVLTIARLMHQRHQTKVPKENIVKELDADVSRPNSLYLRVLDEEIILEEEMDALTGRTNVIFVYDTFSEYAIALSIFSDFEWHQKGRQSIQHEAIHLMREETVHKFASLRGALEFAVLRIEDQRLTAGIHFDIIRAMLNQDWKWRRIGTLLAFRLTQTQEEAFWTFIEKTLVHNEREFVRRICAEQLGRLMAYDAERAIPLLNQCLMDKSDSVRAMAKETLLNLDPVTAIREVETLIRDRPLNGNSLSLATETLLSPRNSRSLLLQNKARWLVKENQNDVIQTAVLAHLAALELPPYEDLYALEEYARAFQVDWKRDHQPGNLYLDMIQQQLIPRSAALRADVQRLETLHTLRHRLFISIARLTPAFHTEADTVWKTELASLVDDPQERNQLLRHIEAVFRVSFPRWIHNVNPNAPSQLITVGTLVVEIARSTPAFTDPSSHPGVVGLPPQAKERQHWHTHISQTSRLMQLCNLTDALLNEATTLARRNPSNITLSTDLGEGDLAWEPVTRNRFQNKFAAQIGVELTPVQHRTLSTLGRLSLWLWQAEELAQQRENALKKSIGELRFLDTGALQRHFSSFEKTPLSGNALNALRLELQAICRLYAAAQPARIAEALAPLIIWHSEHESPDLGEAFQTLYWREQTGFWDVAHTLLDHEDQRVIDFANQILEQAEHAEASRATEKIYDRVRATIVDILGIEAAQVTSESHLRRDLGADSLDLVELIMAFEDEFGGRMPDEDARQITTVGEAVEYIARRVTT